MREHPDHHDAELLLRLYDLRREARLREAREWTLAGLEASSVEELFKKYPRGSKENASYRMAVSYWDMAASMVVNGLIKEEFFFENTTEFWVVWQRVKPLAPEMRATYKNPFYLKNLETIAEKFEKWMEQRAPGALDVMRKRLQAMTAKPSRS
jgi:hypothetical protein